MDYSIYRCPVCEKPFENDSEVVVCPECGAPHHRDCYNKIGHCFYEDKHKDGFDFRAESNNDNKQNKENNQTKYNNYNHTNNPGSRNSDIIACKNCGTFNVASNDVCNNCGAKLEKEQSQQNPYQRQSYGPYTPPQSGRGNTQQPFPGFAFDPMGGLNPDEELAEGVTVSDVSKFTKNNTPFFCRLFHQIKNTNRSRFSFVGFIFHGGWFLYRKMYKIGIIVTTLMALMIISQLYIQTFYEDLMKGFAEALANTDSASVFDAVGSFFTGLDVENQIVMAIYGFSSIGQYILCIICALCANRWYYKHTMKTITKIKNTPGTKEETESAIQAKGGVNGTLAISLLLTYAVLSFLPYFF